MQPDDKPSDPLPGLIADLDQALALAPQAARMIRGHYLALVEAGFSESQALYAAVLFIGGRGAPPTG